MYRITEIFNFKRYIWHLKSLLFRGMMQCVDELYE